MHHNISTWQLMLFKNILTIKQEKCADLAAQNFDSISHFQVLVKEDISKKMHKYMCNQIKNTTLPNTSVYRRSVTSLCLSIFSFSLSTQCAGQHVELIPCTAITSQSTLSNAVCRLRQEGINRTNFCSTGQTRLRVNKVKCPNAPQVQLFMKYNISTDLGFTRVSPLIPHQILYIPDFS